MSETVSIIIAVGVALLTLLVACGSVIGFVWRMYNKIEERHTATARAIHKRLDEIFKLIAKLDKKLAIVQTRLDIEADADTDE